MFFILTNSNLLDYSQLREYIGKEMFIQEVHKTDAYLGVLESVEEFEYDNFIQDVPVTGYKIKLKNYDGFQIILRGNRFYVSIKGTDGFLENLLKFSNTLFEKKEEIVAKISSLNEMFRTSFKQL